MWSEGRDSKQSINLTQKLRSLEEINKALLHLAKDENFKEDLKLPVIQVAIRHWTGVERLSPGKANRLTEGKDSRIVMEVMTKFRWFQAICQQHGIPVPLKDLLSQSTKLNSEWAVKYFDAPPDGNMEPSNLPAPSKASSTTSPKQPKSAPKKKESNLVSASSKDAVDSEVDRPTSSSVTNIADDKETTRAIGNLNKVVENQSSSSSYVLIMAMVVACIAVILFLTTN